MRDIDRIHEILKFSTLAPSVDNCQPWIFSLTGNTVNIQLDRPRAEFFGDYAFTASYVTMGTVVENLTIAAANMHMNTEVCCFPERGSDDPVVRVTFTDNTDSNQVEPELFSCLETRCTNRRPYRQEKLAQSTLQSLHELVSDKARLLIIDDTVLIRQLSEISMVVDQVIFEHQQLHENLFRWMRWTDREILDKRDGMGIKTLELGFADQCAFRMISSWPFLSILNLFGVSKIIAKINSGLIRKSAAVGLLIVEGSEDQDYFHGGRLLERVWLQSTLEGLAFQPYGGMPFLLTRIKKAGNVGFCQKHFRMLQNVERKMADFAGIKGNETLIMLFRLGNAEPPSERTNRRPLSEVLS